MNPRRGPWDQAAKLHLETRFPREAPNQITSLNLSVNIVVKSEETTKQKRKTYTSKNE
jgi:hypothetical protein